MEILMAFVCGFLFMAAIYLILSRSLSTHYYWYRFT